MIIIIIIIVIIIIYSVLGGQGGSINVALKVYWMIAAENRTAVWLIAAEFLALKG